MMPSVRNTPTQPPAIAELRLEPETTTSRISTSSTPSKPTGQRRSGRLSAQNLVLTSLLWSLALVTVAEAQLPPCGSDHPFVGFKGKFSADIGTIEIIDDCTFVHETRFGFNNASIRGLQWGGMFQNSQGTLQTIGVVSSSVISGSDLPVPYRLLPGLGWSSFDFLTVQSVGGDLVAAAPLGRPNQQAPPTTSAPAPPATTTRVVTTTARIPTTAPTTTVTPPRTIVISPPGANTFVPTPTNRTALPLKTPVATITDPASPLIVRIGQNPNYPGDTPFLNVSLWINDTETPVLVLTRGKRYTFSIQAGTAHPVYITTSREGGKKVVANSTELVVAGNITTFGTISAPMVWDFVAPLKGEIAGLNDTQALWYQCYVHRRMGWRILLQDADFPNVDSGALNANVAPRSVGGIALGVLVLAAFMMI